MSSYCFDASIVSQWHVLCCTTTCSWLYVLYMQIKVEHYQVWNQTWPAHCEASHILRVKGEILYSKLCGLTGMCAVWQHAATVSPQTGQCGSCDCKKLWRTAQKERNRLCLCPLNPSTLLFSSLSITGIPNGYECFSACFPQSCVLTISSHCKWHLQGRGRPSFLCRGHASKSISLEMRFTE